MGSDEDDIERGVSSHSQDNGETESVGYEADPREYAKRHYVDVPDGYPRLASWMSSGENAVTLRQFRYLQVRSLLHLQDELRQLEHELFTLDERDRREQPHHLTSREASEEDSSGRKALMEGIRGKWTEYAELAMLSNRVVTLEKPSRHEIRSIKNFWHECRPLVEEEGFLFDKGDLVNLEAPGDVAWLDEVLLNLLVWLSCPPLRWIFARPEQRKSHDKAPNTIVYSPYRIHIFKTSLLIVLLMALLTVPLYPLYDWTKDGDLDGKTIAGIMGLQCGCTLAFGVVLTACTKARRVEIFMACSAYMALLIVFFGQVGS